MTTYNNPNERQSPRRGWALFCLFTIFGGWLWYLYSMTPPEGFPDIAIPLAVSSSVMSGVLLLVACTVRLEKRGVSAPEIIFENNIISWFLPMFIIVSIVFLSGYITWVLAGEKVLVALAQGLVFVYISGGILAGVRSGKPLF